MDYDRVRFFGGVDGESTLISADNMPESPVVSRGFLTFLEIIEHNATFAVDWLRSSAENTPAVAYGAIPIPFPRAAQGADIRGYPRSGDMVVAVRPPLSGEGVRLVMRYIDAYRGPESKRPLYLDHRNGHDGCRLDPKTGLPPQHEHYEV